MKFSAIFLAASLVVAAPAPAKCTEPNLIFMISDGFGLTSETLARGVQQHTKNANDWTSVLDSLLVGASRTKSSSSLVTDSAAGATAYSCHVKSYNGAIGVDADGKPCGTILEAAKLKGMKTGLVTTSRITHATPAAFAAHVKDRDMEDLIAQQMLAGNETQPLVDLMLGGGLCHFLPQSAKDSCRDDNMDLWSSAKSQLGYNRATNPGELKTANTLPLLGLFSDSHMSYSIDRNPKEQPSLKEMTSKALDLLSNASGGFFLMIEGARIDMAGHDNDPATHYHDIVEYWETVQRVKDFIDQHPNTLLVSTSDHETGGLTLGIDHEYVWYPEELVPQRESAESLCKAMKKAGGYLDGRLGIELTKSEIEEITGSLDTKGYACKHAVGHAVSRRAHIGWSTGGHTGTDVGLFAYGRGSKALKGSFENTQVGKFISQYLGVDLQPVTESLQGIETSQPGFKRRSLIRDFHHHD